MAKAKKAKIKKAKRSTQLPLDDVRWIPVAKIIEWLLPHIDNKILIAHDLTEALASKKIRCMRRIVTGPADDAAQRAMELKQRVPGATLLTRSSDGTLFAEPFFGPVHHRLFKAIDRVRASHGEEITPQLIIDSMGRDADKILSDGNTVGQYIKALAAEAILPPNVLGHRELVPASLWVECCFMYSNGDIGIAVPPSTNHVPLFISWARKSAFYLWQPDCVKVWPVLKPREIDGRKAKPRPARKRLTRKASERVGTGSAKEAGDSVVASGSPQATDAGDMAAVAERRKRKRRGKLTAEQIEAGRAYLRDHPELKPKQAHPGLIKVLKLRSNVSYVTLWRAFFRK